MFSSDFNTTITMKIVIFIVSVLHGCVVVFWLEDLIARAGL